MWNADFIFGVAAGAVLIGLVGFFLRVEQHAKADVASTLGEASTWNVVTQATSPASSNTVLSIAPTLISVPRRGRKPAVKKTPKTPSVKRTKTTKPASKSRK